MLNVEQDNPRHNGLPLVSLAKKKNTPFRAPIPKSGFVRHGRVHVTVSGQGRHRSYEKNVTGKRTVSIFMHARSQIRTMRAFVGVTYLSDVEAHTPRSYRVAFGFEEISPSSFLVIRCGTEDR
jgi:hypothetical protein